MKKLPTSSFLQASSSPLNYLEPPLNYLGPPLNYLEPPLDYVGHHLNYVPLPLDLLGASFELLEATFELRGAAQQTNGWTIEVEVVGCTITDRSGTMTKGGGERGDAGLQRQGSVGWWRSGRIWMRSGISIGRRFGLTCNGIPRGPSHCNLAGGPAASHGWLSASMRAIAVRSMRSTSRMAAVATRGSGDLLETARRCAR